MKERKAQEHAAAKTTRHNLLALLVAADVLLATPDAGESVRSSKLLREVLHSHGKAMLVSSHYTKTVSEAVPRAFLVACVETLAREILGTNASDDFDNVIHPWDRPKSSDSEDVAAFNKRR